jgi:hypothetical protein
MIILYIIIGLVAFSLIMWVALGVTLPKDMVITRTVFVKAPIEQTWETITDLTRQTQWRSDLQKLEIKDSIEGLDVWTEILKSGEVLQLKTLISKPLNTLQLELRPNSVFKGFWEGQFIKNQSGTTLRIKETSRVANPLYRPYIKLFQNFDHLVERYHDDLKRHFG